MFLIKLPDVNVLSPVRRVITKVHSIVVYSVSLREGGRFSEGASRGHRGWCLPALEAREPGRLQSRPWTWPRGADARDPGPRRQVSACRPPPRDAGQRRGLPTRGYRLGARDGRGRPLPNPPVGFAVQPGPGPPRTRWWAVRTRPGTASRAHFQGL